MKEWAARRTTWESESKLLNRYFLDGLLKAAPELCGLSDTMGSTNRAAHFFVRVRGKFWECCRLSLYIKPPLVLVVTFELHDVVWLLCSL